MREILTTMTQRGQVTVPAEVRGLLRLKPRDKVAFTIEDDRVELRAAAFTLETAYRSVPPLGRKLTDGEIARVAKEQKAQDTLRELERR